MRIGENHRWFGLPLLLGAFLSRAQSGPVLHVAADRSQILIGEPIRLRCQLETHSLSSLRWFRPDSLAHFQWLEVSKPDTVQQAEGQWVITQQLGLTSFDSGTQWIPPLSVQLEGQTIFSDSIRVEVGYAATDRSQDYHGLHDLVEVDHPWLPYIRWGVVGCLALSLLGLVLALRRLRPPARPAEQGPLPVSSLAGSMQELEALEKAFREHPMEPKQYYTQLMDIFKKFLNRGLGLRVRDRTTSEMLVTLKDRIDTPIAFTRLAGEMRKADAVKFARYYPQTQECLDSLEVLRHTILQLPHSQT